MVLHRVCVLLCRLPNEVVPLVILVFGLRFSWGQNLKQKSKEIDYGLDLIAIRRKRGLQLLLLPLLEDDVVVDAEQHVR